MSYAELMGFKKNFGFYDGPTGMPCNLTIITLPQATVTITLGAKNYTTTADNTGYARFSIGDAGLWSVVSVKDDITQVGTVRIENVVTAALDLPRSLEDFSWGEISAISKAGIASKNFSIGDTKKIQIGGEFFDAQIIGFDHDTVSTASAVGYNREKAGITFETKQVMTNSKRLVTNQGSAYIYTNSEMRMTTLPNILNTMDEELTNIIVPVKKYTSNAFSTSSWSIDETEDKLFILSEEEVLGTYKHAGEGTRYSYYQQESTSRTIRYDLNGTARQRWTRSPWYTGSYNDFMRIEATGAEGHIAGTNTGTYYSFAFCV